MTQTITVNTSRSNLATALVAGITQPYTPKAFPQIVFGETLSVNVYLIDNAGVYDSRSGTNGYNPRISFLLPTLQPTSGTFTISDGVETIKADYDASAVEMETALNAMNANSGPFGNMVSVQKFSNGSFSIIFDVNGAAPLLTISASGIQPKSAGSVLPLVEGSATSQENQLIRILAEPLVFEDSSTEITNGWNMTLNANNSNILRALAADQGDISANFSIDIIDPNSKVDVIARGPVILKQGSFDVAALSGINYPDILNLNDAIIQRVDIIGLTGGTNTDLDSIATFGLSVDYTVFTGVEIGALVPSKQWTLTSGVEAEDTANGIVRPDDYNEITNAKYWKSAL